VVNAKRIARLMRAHGMRGVSRRRGFVVTTRRDKTQDKAPDLEERIEQAARRESVAAITAEFMHAHRPRGAWVPVRPVRGVETMVRNPPCRGFAACDACRGRDAAV
jgi:hypothetical protein